MAAGARKVKEPAFSFSAGGRRSCPNAEGAGPLQSLRKDTPVGGQPKAVILALIFRCRDEMVKQVQIGRDDAALLPGAVSSARHLQDRCVCDSLETDPPENFSTSFFHSFPIE